MRVRLGYACISKTLDNVTTSSSYTYTNFKKNEDFNHLDEVIRSNLDALYEIVKYNICNNIHFFRMSSKMIPLATIEEVKFDYIDKYRGEYKKIGELIAKSSMRVDFHPDQFCILNSVKEEVVKSSIEILKYHYSILEALGIEDKILVLHIGGNTFGKKQAMARFANRFKELDESIRECIVIENDDKIFNIIDCLNLGKMLNIPVVLDYHHYMCNNDKEKMEDIVDDVFDTWKDRTPKVHFSTSKDQTKKNYRAHHEYINVDDFIKFIEIMKKFDRDFDVMIEAKGKDEALFRLVRQLKYRTDYEFIDETTFFV